MRQPSLSDEHLHPCTTLPPRAHHPAASVARPAPAAFRSQPSTVSGPAASAGPTDPTLHEIDGLRSDAAREATRNSFRSESS